MATVESSGFGELLRRYRRERGLTQEELAERATLSVRAISDLERGLKLVPHRYTVQMLAEALALSDQDRAALKGAILRRHGPMPRPTQFAPSLAFPVPSTPFIGRRREVEELGAILRREGVRLVTLTGPGGVGKTRLALRSADGVGDSFPDGVVFVSLAPLADPGLVPSAIATGLEIKEASEQPVLDGLIWHLREKRLLLLIDNFEHLLPAAEGISYLLTACPRLTILVTSRAALHLLAEQEYPVPPLPIPPPGLELGVEALSRYDAIQLFVLRARAVKPLFQLTKGNAAPIAEICSRLDGLPLAIELAAARTRVFPPQALLGRLSRPLQLLTGGARDLPTRHHALRATIDWSYRLLEPEEQALFARLAVFAGGCTLEAAEAVCDVEGDLGIDVLDGVTSLVEKSLLLVAEGGGEPRFRMLETVREHALEQLAARGEADRVRRRHAEAYLRLAEEAERDSSTPDRPAWMARLEGENDNLRAALTWSLEREGTGELALRLAGALAWFWSKRLDLNEGRRWLEQCLRLSTATGVTQRLPRAWARVLTGIADLAHTQGDFATALTYAEQAVTVWRPLDDKGGLARGLRMLAWLAQRQGDHARERALLDELVGLSRDEGRADLTTQALFAMARADLYLGNLAAARVRLEETLELSRKTGHLPSLARVLCMLAEIAWFQGDTAARCRFYEAGLACTSSLTDPMELSSHLARLAWVARRVGDYEQAETLVRQRLAVARGQMGPADAWWLVAWSLNHLGDVARCRDDVGRAASLYEESLTLFRQHGDRQGIAAVLHNQGRVALAQGDAGRARALFLESLSLFRQLNFVWSVADCLMGLAGVAGQEGRPERAALLFGAAAAAHEAIDASGALVEPANQLAWEREMRAARDELDTKAWEGAWSAGRAMSIDQALACEDLPALPPRV